MKNKHSILIFIILLTEYYIAGKNKHEENKKLEEQPKPGLNAQPTERHKRYLEREKTKNKLAISNIIPDKKEPFLIEHGIMHTSKMNNPNDSKFGAGNQNNHYELDYYKNQNKYSNKSKESNVKLNNYGLQEKESNKLGSKNQNEYKIKDVSPNDSLNLLTSKEEALKKLNWMISNTRFRKLYEDGLLEDDYFELIHEFIKLLNSDKVSSLLLNKILLVIFAYENYINNLEYIADNINKIKATFYISKLSHYRFLVTSFENLKKDIETNSYKLQEKNKEYSFTQLFVLIEVILSVLNDTNIHVIKDEKVYERIINRFNSNSSWKQFIQDPQYTRAVSKELPEKLSRRIKRIDPLNDLDLEKIKMTLLYRYIRLFYNELKRTANNFDLDGLILEGFNDLLNAFIPFLRSAEQHETPELGFIEIWITFDFYAYMALKRDLNYLLNVISSENDLSALSKICYNIKNILDTMEISSDIVKYTLIYKKTTHETVNIPEKPTKLEYYHYRPGNELRKYNIGIIARGSNILKLSIIFLTKTEKYIVLSKDNTLTNNLDDIKNAILVFFNNGEYRASRNIEKWNDTYKYLKVDLNNLIRLLETFRNTLQNSNENINHPNENKEVNKSLEQLLSALSRLRVLRKTAYENIDGLSQINEDYGFITAYNSYVPQNLNYLSDEKIIETISPDLIKGAENVPNKPLKIQTINKNYYQENYDKLQRSHNKIKQDFEILRRENIEIDKIDFTKYYTYSRIYFYSQNLRQLISDLIHDREYSFLKYYHNSFIKSLNKMFNSVNMDINDEIKSINIIFRYNREEYNDFKINTMKLKNSLKNLSKNILDSSIGEAIKKIEEFETIFDDIVELEDSFVETINVNISELRVDDNLKNVMPKVGKESNKRVSNKKILSELKVFIDEFESDNQFMHLSVLKIHLIKILSNIYSYIKDKNTEDYLLDEVSDILMLSKNIVKRSNYVSIAPESGENQLDVKDLDILIEALVKFKDGIMNSVAQNEDNLADFSDIDYLQTYKANLEIKNSNYIELVKANSEKNAIDSLNKAMDFSDQVDIPKSQEDTNIISKKFSYKLEHGNKPISDVIKPDTNKLKSKLPVTHKIEIDDNISKNNISSYMLDHYNKDANLDRQQPMENIKRKSNKIDEENNVKSDAPIIDATFKNDISPTYLSEINNTSKAKDIENLVKGINDKFLSGLKENTGEYKNSSNDNYTNEIMSDRFFYPKNNLDNKNYSNADIVNMNQTKNQELTNKSFGRLFEETKSLKSEIYFKKNIGNRIIVLIDNLKNVLEVHNSKLYAEILGMLYQFSNVLENLSTENSEIKNDIFQKIGLITEIVGYILNETEYHKGESTYFIHYKKDNIQDLKLAIIDFEGVLKQDLDQPLLFSLNEALLKTTNAINELKDISKTTLKEIIGSDAKGNHNVSKTELNNLEKHEVMHKTTSSLKRKKVLVILERTDCSACINRTIIDKLKRLY